jgi:hypothetical protein
LRFETMFCPTSKAYRVMCCSFFRRVTRKRRTSFRTFLQSLHSATWIKSPSKEVQSFKSCSNYSSYQNPTSARKLNSGRNFLEHSRKSTDQKSNKQNCRCLKQPSLPCSKLSWSDQS